MNDPSFSTAFTVDRTPEEAFAAVNNVRAWWAGDIEGSTDALGDEFTYRYEDAHYSKQKVVELVPHVRVVWQVLDARLTFTRDRSEWKDTQIRFDISPHGDGTQVRFTHVGLVPDIECFDACSNAWAHYVNGCLRTLIGAGSPAS